MSSISASECGTEWWCPVVAKEHFLRWGLLLGTIAWVVMFEWNRYQKTRPLIQMFQSKLTGFKGFRYDTDRAVSLGMQTLVGIIFQFTSKDGVPASAGQKWIHALIACFALLLTCLISKFGFEAPGRVRFTDSANNSYRIYSRSAKGPFILDKSNAENEFVTVDELVASVAKPKSD